jgi:hypothetical protein
MEIFEHDPQPSNQLLKGKRVRVIKKTYYEKPLGERELYRGIVLNVDRVGLFLRGVKTFEQIDLHSKREYPCNEKEGQIFLPWSSIEAVEIITEDEHAEMVNSLVMKRRPRKKPPIEG